MDNRFPGTRRLAWLDTLSAWLHTLDMMSRS
jgi:hypothetical protein